MVNMDSSIHADLINTRFAYVAVSRASRDAHIYTNSTDSLISNLAHTVTKSSALENSASPSSAPSLAAVVVANDGLGP